jgi:transcriptional regulator with XRE-family HTH domain
MKSQDLKSAREQHGWTQQQAAAHLAVSQPYLSLLESGKRTLTPRLMRRVARAYGLPPTVLPPADLLRDKVAPVERELAEDLANLDYPGFAYLRSRRPKKNPMEVLLVALAKDDLEPRLTEALPWLLLRHELVNTEYLVRQARLHNMQNRLGFVVNLARRAAEGAPHYLQRVPALLRLEQELEQSRLAREDTLCWATLPEVKRRWLADNRPHEAAHWNLLTDWRPEDLRYVD